ncbi:unnamed protein product [Leptidea sinapis]|uniref:Uncharacterized protein n=1 Tax=Leptidea sinapis TaxID=189913 RepID=A0A5E4QXS9_9NEOP|nr:unnamed protein product [Leptidea sinapis]
MTTWCTCCICYISDMPWSILKNAKWWFVQLLQVSGVTWWDSARLVAITLGAPIVLVVDIGAVNVEVVPVVHGLVVLHAMESEPLGTSAVHRELARLLQEEHGPEMVLEPAELEDITAVERRAGDGARCDVPAGSGGAARQWGSTSRRRQRAVGARPRAVLFARPGAARATPEPRGRATRAGCKRVRGGGRCLFARTARATVAGANPPTDPATLQGQLKH